MPAEVIEMEEMEMTQEFESALMPDKPDLKLDDPMATAESMGEAAGMTSLSQQVANPYAAELTRIGSFRAFLQANYGARFLRTFRQLMEHGAVPEYPGRDAVWCDFRYQYPSASIERIEFYTKSQHEIFADFIILANISCLDRGSGRLLEQQTERFRMRCVLTLGQSALSCTEILGISLS